jgi:periplasmic protein TonB
MSFTLRLLTLRMLPMAASLLVHAVACGAIILAPGWSFVREAIIIAELVPDPEPPAPAAKPAPRMPDSRPLKPPRPIQTPMPKPVEPPVETPAVTPPPPAAVAPPTAPSAPAPPSFTATAPESAPSADPVASAGRGPLAPADAPPAIADGQGLPTQSGPPAPARPAAPSVAALPSDRTTQAGEITQTAAPRGGYQVKPSYPTSARRAGIQGTTLLGVFVAADGRVGDVVVKQSAGHPDLDAAAADAVRRWRFEPARRGSEPVAMWVLLPVEFRLR